MHRCAPRALWLWRAFLRYVCAAMDSRSAAFLAIPMVIRATAVLPRQCVYHPDLELGQYEELLASVLLDASIR
jgi:hypothetical protein